MTDHSKCRELAKQEITSVADDRIKQNFGGSYGDALRATMPPYFWNRIKAPTRVHFTDEELRAQVRAANGDVEKLIALVRRGAHYDDFRLKCEWCNEPLDDEGSTKA